jgi:hypothetical protein
VLSPAVTGTARGHAQRQRDQQGGRQSLPFHDIHPVIVVGDAACATSMTPD